MRKWYILIFVSTLIFSSYHEASGINANIKKKYPNVLLTDDYGILARLKNLWVNSANISCHKLKKLLTN